MLEMQLRPVEMRLLDPRQLLLEPGADIVAEFPGVLLKFRIETDVFIYYRLRFLRSKKVIRVFPYDPLVFLYVGVVHAKPPASVSWVGPYINIV